MTSMQKVEQREALSKITLRERLVRFMLFYFAFLLICTMMIIFLQGFHLWGFALDPSFLNKIGIAVIGEVASILAAASGYLFENLRRKTKNSPKSKKTAVSKINIGAEEIKSSLASAQDELQTHRTF